MRYFIAPTAKQYLTSHITSSAPSDETTCPICSDEWNADTQAIVHTACNAKHVFHKACLAGWFECGNTCPSCRAVCFLIAKPWLGPAVSESPPRPYNQIHAGHVTDLDDCNAWQAEFDYEAFILQIESMVAPIMDQDEVFEQFRINLDDDLDSTRFDRAFTCCLSAGFALCRFPPNLLEGWMPELKSRLHDWDTIAYLIATLFIQTYWPMMSPQEWVDVLAQRNTLYQAALKSKDFELNTKEWLDYINSRTETRYEIFGCADWPAEKLFEVHWHEVDACGNQTTARNWMYLTPGRRVFEHYDFVQFSGGDKAVLSYDGTSLWLNETVVGGLSVVEVHEKTRTVVIRNSADKVMVLEFCPARPVVC